MQSPREDSSGHPLWGQLRGGGRGSWQSLRLPGQPLTSESSSRPGSPEVLVRGLQQPQTTAPSPKCPATSELAILGTSWLQSLCRWEAERYWETPILHPSFLLCQRLWTHSPDEGEAKLKSHHCSSSPPRHLLRQGNSLYRSCSHPDCRRNSPFRLGTLHSPNLAKTAGPGQCPKKPWGRASPSTTGLSHTASRYDETSPPRITHCRSLRHPAPLCLVARRG